jgi:hypothetical protein
MLDDFFGPWKEMQITIGYWGILVPNTMRMRLQVLQYAIMMASSTEAPKKYEVRGNPARIGAKELRNSWLGLVVLPSLDGGHRCRRGM